MARFEVAASFFRFAAQRRRQQGGHDAEVEMCAAVFVGFIEFNNSLHGGAHLGQVSDRIPVAAVRLDPSGPGGGEGVERRHIVLAQRGQRGTVIVIRAMAEATQFCTVAAQGAIRVVARLAGQALARSASFTNTLA